MVRYFMLILIKLSLNIVKKNLINRLNKYLKIYYKQIEYHIFIIKIIHCSLLINFVFIPLYKHKIYQ